MLDYSAGEISSPESAELVATLDKQLGNDKIKFYSGVGYRQLVIWKKGPKRWKLTPPHDIMGKRINSYLPEGEGSELVIRLMKDSYPLLANLKVNKDRVNRGLNPANSIWLWGEGTKPNLPLFKDKYGLRGAVISATDLIKGIAYYAGMRIIEVEGATGTIDTNYAGKAKAALGALDEGDDLVFIHIEAPDECSHQGRVAQKIESIELIDRQVLGVVKEGLDARGLEYSLLFLPDHVTPLSLRTHASDPVPFLFYRSSDPRVRQPGQRFTEENASRSGTLVREGDRLMDLFLAGTL